MMTKNNPEVLDGQDPSGDTAQNAAQADQKPTVQEGKKIKVRVLLDCEHGQCNDVSELTAAQAKRAEEDGLVDSNPKAVAHAIKERKEA
ncbi:hypothetical protein [Mesorhizobium japonicum]|uniref:hypothetical protein n=1 Tax=Mesorhizobium japonicum TaxID=2066070 RepID=UPI003B5C89D4